MLFVEKRRCFSSKHSVPVSASVVMCIIFTCVNIWMPKQTLHHISYVAAPLLHRLSFSTTFKIWMCESDKLFASTSFVSKAKRLKVLVGSLLFLVRAECQQDRRAVTAWFTITFFDLLLLFLSVVCIYFKSYPGFNKKIFKIYYILLYVHYVIIIILLHLYRLHLISVISFILHTVYVSLFIFYTILILTVCFISLLSWLYNII